MYIIYIYNFLGKRKKKKEEEEEKQKKAVLLRFPAILFLLCCFRFVHFFWKFLAEYDALPRLFSEIRRFTIFLFSL